MKRFLRKNRRLRKRLTKTKERVVETIQLLNAAALQQMNEEKKKKKNEKMINADEKSTKNVKMKRIVKEKFSKKENPDTMMSEIVDVKNSNAIIFMKYHIDDTTTTSSNFTKEKSLKKKRRRELREDEKEEDR